MGSVDERVGKMLQATSGRDQIMALFQFVPGVLEPAARPILGDETAESMLALGGLAAQYRGMTRLQSTYLLVVAKLKQLQEGGPDGSTLNKLLVHLKWVLDVGFAMSELLIIFTKAGIINRKENMEKVLGRLGPRCVWFFFWGLLTEQIRIWLMLSKMPDTEKEKKNGLLRGWLGYFLWFLVAWAGQPKGGVKAGLLANPEAGSVLLPFHRIMEMTTVPGLPTTGFQNNVLGLLASAMPVMGEWAKTAAK